MKKTIAAFATGLLGFAAAPAMAETCGGVYVVQRGDSLSLIADEHYKDVGRWTLIHSQNISSIGPRPSNLGVGMRLDMPCIDGLPTGLPGGREVVADAEPVKTQAVVVPRGDASVRTKINILTGNGREPYSDQNSHNGGLITDIVDAAMTKAAPEQGHAIHFITDWGAHFDPMLSNALLDMGFPWYKPNCDRDPENYRCTSFLFSDPMFEMLELVFASKASGLQFNTDDDIIGHSICRQDNTLAWDMDENGRNWLKDGKVELKRAPTIQDCFAMMLAGDVDFVGGNEFQGREVMKTMDIKDQVNVMNHPMSLQALYVLVHQSHPQAQEMLDVINAGLAGIREDGSYQKIVEDHMTLIWSNF
ncbi:MULTISPECIES: transporter substrate-binding domain-containing protein [Pacificibacter]|uniref:transporter substrate-binding domain-containing protein n=1 Tax=Pacificibacter TaxID=1042323 RepID=UPI001C0A29A1|nr:MULTISPECIES: transporter substrate-binding domain-containing protein [Pacificibacter]MBU2937050.1 transporter substrate-binding domain-containing protein [Pacificibacter marinus]MDO6616410.1 transporter substrate-binding domain-containing protein [Pacificibacter sp. 1_MG-2023]